MANEANPKTERDALEATKMAPVDHICACFPVEMLPEAVSNRVLALVEHGDEMAALLSERHDEVKSWRKCAKGILPLMPAYDSLNVTRLEAELEVMRGQLDVARAQRRSAFEARDKEQRCHADDMLRLETALTWIKMVCTALKDGPLKKAALDFADDTKEIPF